MFQYKLSPKQNLVKQNFKQAEAEVVPSSSLVEVEVGIEVWVGVKVGVEVEVEFEVGVEVGVLV